MGHMMVAMMSGRALVYDNWLPGFDFPLQFDYMKIPSPHREKVSTLKLSVVTFAQISRFG